MKILEKQAILKNILAALIILVMLFLGQYSFIAVYFFAGLWLGKLVTRWLAWVVYSPIITFVSYAVQIGQTASLIEMFKFGGLVLLPTILMIYLIYRVVEAWVLLKDSQQLGYLSDDQLFFDDEIFAKADLGRQDKNFIQKDLKQRYEIYLYLRSHRLDDLVTGYDRTLQDIQTIFVNMTIYPENMLEMKDFLYTHLPAYHRVAKGLIALRDNIVKTPEDDTLIAKAAQALTAMRQDFKNDLALQEKLIAERKK